MESGGSDSAKAQLDKLREAVSKKIDTVYFENLYVDAVLVENTAFQNSAYACAVLVIKK